ncbi:MAG: multiheme c-type cytochrome [Pyrinomonadaceae bacterium]
MSDGSGVFVSRKVRTHESSPQRRLARELFSDARAAVLALFVAVSAALLLSPVVASVSSTVIQRRPTTRSQPRRAAPAHDYSRFSHSSLTHARRDCATCHVVASFEQPDIKDFPDHPSCVACHRQQFFRGTRPAICSDCHTSVSPRAGARFKFPKPAAPSEFTDVFPHANHIKSTSLIQFKKVIGEKSSIQATCLYCHKVSAAKLTPPPGAGTGAGAFSPPPGTFMTTPTSHTTCFQCHWQKGVADHEQEPYANQCAKCHRNLASPVAVASKLDAIPNTGGANAARIVPAALTTTPRLSFPPTRVTPKFVHELEAHKKKLNDEGREVLITCLQCHAAARKAETLEVLRAKENRAGLLTCSSSACHTAVAGAAQMHLSVYQELKARSKEAKFDCALCHTPPLSLREEIPCSHYVAVFASATKEKKGTKGIEQLTPPRCAEELKKVMP